jgi:MFS family permease
MSNRTATSSTHELLRRDACARSTLSQLVGGAVIAVLFMGSTLITPLYDLYAKTYGLSVVAVGLLYAVYVVGNLIALLFFGRVSDQIGRRPIVLVSVALAAVSTLLYLFAHTPAMLFIARAVSGLAVGIGSGAATAWITELTAPPRRAGAASVMTAFNFIGLALGPISSGVLVQYAPAPLQLSFEVYLFILAALVVAVASNPETLRRHSRLSLHPRLGVPRAVRWQFIAPAAAGFAAMALVGFYAALGPSTLQQALHVSNRAVSGAVVAELFIVAVLVIIATRNMPARTSLQLGLLSMPVGVALLVVAQRSGSMPLMLLSSAVCGFSAALGYRSGLAVASGLAPEERRAEVASTYFVCCFLGNALPIIGVTALTQRVDASGASLVFAIVLSVIGITALVAIRQRPPE